jgi:hypothetical protein
MNRAFSRAFRAALCAGLALAGTAQAGIITYNIDIPTVGSGWLSYDDAAIVPVGIGGDYSAPLADFSFSYNGWTYTAADSTTASAGDFAWFADPGPAFVGVQYQGEHGGVTIDFSAGFGSGDLGSFAATDGGSAGLGNGQFTLATAVPAVPEPGTLACVLAGFGGLAWRMKRGRGVALPV